VKYLARRLAWALAVVWAVTTLAFFVNNVLPSDPARMIAGPQARPQDVEKIRKQLGLDRPIVAQYALFMRRLVHVAPGGDAGRAGVSGEHANCAAFGRVHLDLGRSYVMRRPVCAVLGERLPRTAFLAVAAMIVQLVLGAGAGMLAATKKGTLLDHGAVAATLLGISAPTFVTGLLLQFVLAHKLHLLPIDGFGDTAADHAVSVVLPALTLGMFGAAYYTRLVRDEMIVLLKQDYVRTARAKGVPRWRVVVVHAARNALVPLVTVVALDLGALVGGAIVTETLFRWPGLGALSVSALLDRDGPMILGTVILTSTAIVAANLVADLAYLVLDPRVRRA
jgi:peptide/nickel transport system permease protein